MVTGMATKKVTITLDEAQLDQIRSLVQAGTYSGLGGGRGRAMVKVLGRVQDTFTAINEAVKQQAEARQGAAG